LNVFRLCRIWNYAFVADTPIEALRLELLTYKSSLPYISDIYELLLCELEAYKQMAITYKQSVAFDYTNDFNILKTELWKFWKKYKLVLAQWYKGACEVALIMTSSASCERAFSLYVTMFSDYQQSCLEDRVEGSIMIRYNDNQRKHDNN
jgi:hypothetical protein